MLDKLGRKPTVLISSVLLFLPWLLIIFAQNVWFLYIARFIGGAGTTMALATVSIYNGEMSDPDIRGKLGTTFSWLKVIANCLVLGIGPFVSYVSLGILCAVFPLLLAITFAFVPESPYYLIKTGKKDEARKALMIFAANTTDSSVIEKKLLNIEDSIINENILSLKEFFMGKQFRKLILITIGIKTMQQMSGYMAVKSYLQPIISSTGSSLPAKYSSIIFGAVEIPAAILTTSLIDRAGRKPMLITSCIASAIALISEGTYFFLQDYNKEDVSYLSWLPTTAIVLFIIASNLGIINLPYVLIGELYPSNIKGIAVTVGTCYANILAFLVTKFFAPVSEAWGIYTIFWIYAGFCVAGAIFVSICLPETKGKTLDEIQQCINKSKSSNIHKI
ncbi:PREDICTED: facilitated trehalose transporter Tret1-like isoform X2 [Nicrophorus vespilloides]|nr:PREDICTED: facilitated trehalose transporter Tret1-like isoform X2 [Nicrophorus vespilloides]